MRRLVLRGPAVALTCVAVLSSPAVGDVTVPVTCAGETATIVGTPGDDTLTGTADRDVIAGRAGDDVLDGGGGDDLICGGGGADEIRDVVVGSDDQALIGGRGADTLVIGWRVEVDGTAAPVTLLTDLGERRVLIAETGTSFPLRSFRTVRARYSLGGWSAVGTGRDERFVSHQYVSVHVRARGGRDVVRGSWHDDRIHGGPGRDTAYADRGRDACRSVERGPLHECEGLG